MPPPAASCKFSLCHPKSVSSSFLSPLFLPHNPLLQSLQILPHFVICPIKFYFLLKITSKNCLLSSTFLGHFRSASNPSTYFFYTSHFSCSFPHFHVSASFNNIFHTKYFINLIFKVSILLHSYSSF